MKFLKIFIAITLINFFLIQILVLAYNRLPEKKTVSLNAGKPSLSEIPLTKPSPVPAQVAVTQVENTLVPEATTAPQPAQPAGCIIIIDSKRYDVFEFSKVHSGGDVFRCGTDMTADFYARHDASYLPMMERYRI